MGMSSYVFDGEEMMFDVIEQAIGNCEHLTDVMAEAVKQKNLVPHWCVAESKTVVVKPGKNTGQQRYNKMIAIIGYICLANIVVSIF